MWLVLMFILLIFLLIMLYLRVMEDKHVKKSRSEMPGKVIILTDASTPLGEALARAFYGVGAKMILVGSNRTELERVRTLLFSLRPKDVPVYQPEVAVIELNELEFSAQEKIADIIEMCGQVDMLINNSTIFTRSDIISTTIEDDIRVMNVNYFGPIAFTKAIVPHMVSRKSGSIVFIGSVAGLLAIPFRSSFAASKHALQAFCDVLRAEIAMHNIKVLVSNPEYYPTEVNKGDTTQSPNEVSPEILADEILMSVLRGHNEHMGFSFKFAHWLRVTCPPLFHFMMIERAKKMFNVAESKSSRF